MCTLCQTPIVSVVYRKKRLNTIIRAISHIDTQKDVEYMLEGVRRVWVLKMERRKVTMTPVDQMVTLQILLRRL